MPSSAHVVAVLWLVLQSGLEPLVTSLVFLATLIAMYKTFPSPASRHASGGGGD